MLLRQKNIPARENDKKVRAIRPKRYANETKINLFLTLLEHTAPAFYFL
jgi:hypothetical protein